MSLPDKDTCGPSPAFPSACRQNGSRGLFGVDVFLGAPQAYTRRTAQQKPLESSATRFSMAVSAQVTQKRKLRLIAEKLVEKALEGDNWCIGQVGDRLDGKPKERQEHAGLMDHAIRIIWPGMPAINGEASAPQIENTEPVAALPAPQPEIVPTDNEGND
jgi:hypothetical protein